jgi:hypothetical protein
MGCLSSRPLTPGLRQRNPNARDIYMNLIGVLFYLEEELMKKLSLFLRALASVSYNAI